MVPHTRPAASRTRCKTSAPFFPFANGEYLIATEGGPQEVFQLKFEHFPLGLLGALVRFAFPLPPLAFLYPPSVS